jgi:endonuclease YncB( thermonuclease family)
MNILNISGGGGGGSAPAHQQYKNVAHNNYNTNMICPDNMLSAAAQIEYLQSISPEWKTTPPFAPILSYGKVIKIYDADTITIVSQFCNGSITPTPQLYRFNLRLLGIDSAEIKSHVAAEKECAIRARDALSNLIAGKVVRLENCAAEKYGRILCNVFLEPENLHVNKWLLDNGHAVAYDGGTKTRPTEWG